MVACCWPLLLLFYYYYHCFLIIFIVFFLLSLFYYYFYCFINIFIVFFLLLLIVYCLIFLLFYAYWCVDCVGCSLILSLMLLLTLLLLMTMLSLQQLSSNDDRQWFFRLKSFVSSFSLKTMRCLHLAKLSWVFKPVSMIFPTPNSTPNYIYTCNGFEFATPPTRTDPLYRWYTVSHMYICIIIDVNRSS